MQLLIFLSAILCFSVLAGVSLLRLWLNYQERNILNYDSAYKDDKNSIDQIPKRFSAISIHNYSKMLFGFGLMVSSALILLAFTWQTEEEQSLMENTTAFVEEEVIDLPPLTDIVPPPPPKVQIVDPSNHIEVDDIDFNNEFIEINMEELEVEIENIVSDVKGIDEKNFQKEEEEELFIFVEEPAVFEGGMDNFYKYVSKNLKYPKEAKKQGIEGRIFLQFVVDKDGSLTDIKVAKGVGFGLDEEAKRVLRACPKWKPARQRGKIVKVRMSIPIVFKLD
ncbi:energy transducer TonB [Bernardetia sp. OM2101]|uniref:energy transducer TonB n=1 Tax=Bernardetia sp. OM2101 TaxID=3344876 RepID=UPI0035D05A6C